MYFYQQQIISFNNYFTSGDVTQLNYNLQMYIHTIHNSIVLIINKMLIIY